MRDEQLVIHYASGPSRTGWILNMKSVKEIELAKLILIYIYISLYLFYLDFVKDADWPGGDSAWSVTYF